MIDIDYTNLITPSRLWTRAEILSKPCPIARRPGTYAWYFKEIPPCINSDGCIKFEQLSLLYVGISPSSSHQNGKLPSSQTINDRIRNHFKGNAAGSTLRLTLGCLLSEKLGIQLRRVASGKKMTFGAGEKKLNEWMSENALVTWIYLDKPWILEEELILKLFLPLNLDMNSRNVNHPIVSSARSEAKRIARELPILSGY